MKVLKTSRPAGLTYCTKDERVTHLQANLICYCAYMSAENAPQQPIEIPLEAIATELLNAVIESFVLREGTDYGSNEVSLEKKIEDVTKQMKRGVLKLAFDPNTETVTILTAEQWRRNLAESHP